ncbi:MAG: dihydrodipicolinate synthase family protein [Streptomycetaceae bacterium]|nr:MAG: dihydrodipicolinate synthase family protein [Streptomycetaceae bacterium]
MTKPWHGILTATATPFRSDLSLDFEKYAEHIQWLAANDTHGAITNGSLGEYQVLTPEERAKLLVTAIEAAPKGFNIVAGVGAYGATESRKWAEHAAEVGATALMLLPPTSYRANDDEVVAHYREVGKVGLPIIAYNNPFDTKIDLIPELVAKIADAVENVVAIKEFSGDVRRVWKIHHHAPRIEVLIGADDVLLELATGGVVGWIAGFPNAFPKESAEIYNLALAGKFTEAAPAYAAVHNLFMWDSRKEFIQSIKLAMDVVGRYGGPTRLPRLPLPAAEEAQCRKDIAQAMEFYAKRKN